MGIQLPQSINFSLVPLNGRLRSGNAVMPSDLKYPAGYFAPTVMPMQIVRPASAFAAIGFYSPDHYGFVGRETEIRISVQGGAYPYVPVIVSAPSGATIGTDPADHENYMVLRFTPTENGAQSIIVNVFDQDETLLKINQTFTTSEDWAVFVSPSGNDTTGTGTKALPWATVNKAFATATGGKCLILENGTYTGMSLGMVLSSAAINSMIAWNQRGAILDWSDNIETELGTAFKLAGPHILIQGIIFNNPQTACPSPRIFSTDAVTHYTYQDNCEFNLNGRIGTLNNDNVSCLFFGDSGTQHTNFAQTRCKFTGFAAAGLNGWSAFDTYRISGGAFECNTLSDQRSSTSSAGMIWPKGVGSKNIDIQNNVFESEMGGALIDIYIANAITNGTADGVTGNIDIRHNLIRAAGNAGIWIARSSQDGERLPIFSRRNTLIGGAIVVFNRTFGVTFTSDSDVIQSSIASSDPHKAVIIDSNDPANTYRPLSYMASLTASVTNYECQQNSGVVDSNGLLVGEYAIHRGRRGHEIWKPS